MKYLSVFLWGVAVLAEELETPSFASTWEMPRRELLFSEMPFLRESWRFEENNSLVRGRVKDKLKHGWGAREEIKYYVSDQNWNIAAHYSKIYSQSFESREQEGVLFPLWRQNLSRGPSWRLQIDDADFELGRDFTWMDIVDVRSHVGLRSLWMYQKFDMLDLSSANLVLWNNFFGIGAKSGIDTLWNLGDGMKFFGDGALSILGGYHNIHQQIQSAYLSNSIAIAEFSLGLEYEKIFANQVLNIRVGYEHHYFFNKTRWMNWFSPVQFGNQTDPGALKGLTCSFRLEFK